MRNSSFPQPFRRGVVAAASLIAVTAALTGCGASQEADGGGDATSSATFDQQIHDMLPKEIQDRGEISFGALWETPPVISTDDKNPNKPVGITPELAALMGKVLGVKITWQNLQWPAQLPGLQSGNVDVLFGQVSDNEEREKSIADLVPFQQRGYGLLLPAENSKNVKAIADLCGLDLGLPLGSNSGETLKALSASECVAKGKPAIKFSEFNGATAAIQALRAESIDSWFDTSPNVSNIADSDSKTYTWVPVPESELPAEYTAIAVAKENPKLTAALAAALKAIIEDGSYAKVYDKVPGGDKLELTAEDIVANPITDTPVGEKAS